MLRRRSSRLNPSSDESDDHGSSCCDDEIIDRPYRLRGGAPPAPPPPPPPHVPTPTPVRAPTPPPRRSLTEGPASRRSTKDTGVQTEGEEDMEDEEDDADVIPRSEFRLKMRTEPNKFSGRRELVRILVLPEMDVAELSKCIMQINDLSGTDKVSGLFRESDGLFITLSHILEAEIHNCVWSLSVPHFPIPKPEPWLSQRMMILIGIIALVLLKSFGPMLLWNLRDWTGTAFEVVVNLPLRELYRYGPSAIGWEGMSVPRICARITYHGDEEFWSRNMEECNRIFTTKEEAHLRLVRPMLYIMTMVSVFLAVRSLIREWARSKKVPKPDRDMVETFQAFQMILRQVRKGFSERDYRRN